MTTGKMIATLRVEKGITQKELALRSGVSEISIRKYEASERNPKYEQLQKIATALEIPPSILTGVPMETVALETVGDFISTLWALEERACMEFSYSLLDDGTVDGDTITASFNNPALKSMLARMLNTELEVKASKARKDQQLAEDPNAEVLPDFLLTNGTKKQLSVSPAILKEMMG